MDIPILYETEDIVVINKPAGLMVHADGKKEVRVLTDWILEKYPSIKEVGEPIEVDGKTIYRPGIVHRLDEQTSGALIVAKNQKTFLFLKEQFQNRTIKKEYYAFVWGHFKDQQGIVDIPIGRSKNDFRRWHAGKGTRGEVREALTQYSVREEFLGDMNERFSLVSLFPLTGRTHQLRVHMQYLQRPIVSDVLYGPSKPLGLGFERVALHAKLITFEDPREGVLTVDAPYPKDFETAVAKYCSL